MKKILIKWLGLDTLTAEVETLKAKNAYLSETLDNVEAKVNDLEEPDLSDYVREDEVNDYIESYCNDNEIPSRDWIDSEIEDRVQAAIDNAGIDEQVRDLFNDASPSPMSEEDIKKEVQEQVKITLERVIKSLADGGK